MEDSITGNIKIGKNIHTELLRLSDDAEKKKQQKLQIVAKGKFIENEVPRETSLCQQT